MPEKQNIYVTCSLGGFYLNVPEVKSQKDLKTQVSFFLNGVALALNKDVPHDAKIVFLGSEKAPCHTPVTNALKLFSIP